MYNAYVTWACGHTGPAGYDPERGIEHSKLAAEEYARTHLCPECWRDLEQCVGKRQAGRERDFLLAEKGV